MREIRTLRATWRGLETWAVGTGPAARQASTLPMSGMWKRARVEPLRHRQTKEAATDMFYLTATAPHLNSTATDFVTRPPSKERDLFTPESCGQTARVCRS